uniref:Lipoprotein n=1 Tax=Strongyloides stercoralis TaxID=6248 RepID=A0A0K0EC47_STRER
MIKFILFISIFLTLIISLVFSCIGTICQPFSNTATITYNVEPTPSLTYNTNVTRVSGQFPTAASLAGNLESLANDVIYNIANQFSPYASSFFSHTVTVDQNGLLNANIIPQTCPDNNQRTIAAAGTYYVLDKVVIKRIQPQNCSNGAVQPVPSSPGLTTLNYKINFKILTGQTLCYTHWITIADAIKSRISTAGSIFLGNGVITKPT